MPEYDDTATAEACLPIDGAAPAPAAGPYPPAVAPAAGDGRLPNVGSWLPGGSVWLCAIPVILLLFLWLFYPVVLILIACIIFLLWWFV